MKKLFTVCIYQGNFASGGQWICIGFLDNGEIMAEAICSDPSFAHIDLFKKLEYYLRTNQLQRVDPIKVYSIAEALAAIKVVESEQKRLTNLEKPKRKKARVLKKARKKPRKNKSR